MKVKLDLYAFLMKNETGMWVKGNELITYVHVHFEDLAEFVEIVGIRPFDESGLGVRMFEKTVVIELNDILEADGHEILAYRTCFNEDDVNDHLPFMEERVAERDDY